MTESYIYYPEEQLTGEQLDIFLSKGWYRMQQGIFTTHHLAQLEAIYRVYWLRYDLEKIRFGKKQQRILSMNRSFRTKFLPFRLTPELEELYTVYRDSLSFFPAESVQQWLFGEAEQNVFDSTLIEIRDEKKLIAAGIFDRGDDSLAGIMNFYDPAYKKYSLGKLLMLLKIEAGLSEGKHWYYPGYIAYGYPKFDYKLFADPRSAEVFIPELGSWLPYSADLLEAIEKDRIEEEKKNDTEK